MPFAGSMKLKHFLMLVGGTGAAGAGALGVAAATGAISLPESPTPAVEQTPTPAPRVPTTIKPATRVEGPDKVVMARLVKMGERSLSSSKEKDSFGPGNVKVNLYQDEGHTTVNRLKVDWDRDDQWDEKWTFEDGGGITRQIAPADDEDYSQTKTWDGSGWSGDGPGQQVAEMSPVDAPAPGEGGVVGPGTAIQIFLLERQDTDLGTKKVKDASKGTPWKVNLYQDDGYSVMNRAKVDLDRDDKWDEKWTFDPAGGVSKKVAPNDDEDYSQTWVFDGARWSQEG